ncbi:uncharacterized protein LOC119071278 [Bradysia coprophila]|uniref:uncharacterized protein LOC119071278 n=1 Tax=Bradysia coprophila TaxID=38358 RepID=UPI00187D964D|nr:uncharacterized protein LOC119071278 [Bradysia coprophila]
MSFVKVTASVCLNLLVLNIIGAQSSCDQGWIPYKDEKCVLIHSENFYQFLDAENLCNSLDASLLSIRNQQEQTEFEKIIFDSAEIENSVWLGARGTNGAFVWPDGSPVNFTNWMTSKVESVIDENVECVELTLSGRWSVVSCTRRNLFVCEKEQIWTLHQIQRSFQKFRKEQLENPVPIGFIYVQLSEQPDPQILWPTVSWEQVTSLYAGLFFRAEGPTSNSFNGGAQEDNSPRLTNADSAILSSETTSISMVLGGWSGRLTTGDDNRGAASTWNIRFYNTGGEVRPRNKSVRIWKRVA